MIYGAANRPLLERVPRTASRILDVGCGTGALGQLIKATMDCRIVGVTYSEGEAEVAHNYLDEVVVCDLNTFTPTNSDYFDCIICSHVLEHLYEPAAVLKRLLKALSAEGTLIVALPNVLHWRQRLEFVFGRFKYTDGGLMDRTHYRFFDWVTAQELLSDSGYVVTEAVADGSFPLSKFFFSAGRVLDHVAVSSAPGLFGFQFLFVCRPAAGEVAMS